MALATFILGLFLLIILIKQYRHIFILSLLLLILTAFAIYKNHDFYQNYKILKSEPNHLGLIIEKYNDDCISDINCSKIIKLQPKIQSVLQNFNKTAYFDAYQLAYEMFRSYPLTGIGMNNYKFGCLEIQKYKRNTCWSHPHNFYLQSLTETGIVGFIFFLIYIFFIFKVCINNIKRNIYSKYSIVIMTIIFWPIMSTGSLLKNWHGIETFFVIGLGLSILNLYRLKTT